MGSGASTGKGGSYEVQTIVVVEDKKKKEERRKEDKEEEEIKVLSSIHSDDNSHHSQTSQWLPPKESWPAVSVPTGTHPTENGTAGGSPYGWEPALDQNSKTYYINHVDETSQRGDPAAGGGGGGEEYDNEKPEPREVDLFRDTKLGFGFVAGSEKPVIVRFLTEGGPSENKLLPGDCITHINGENVEKAAREHVIELVRSCQTSITLTVCQPCRDNCGRKSALLTAAKKARLKNNPNRVRFADSVLVNGTPSSTPSNHESYIPFMPNVLKVFLENGQTKSFKYDNKTTVKDVLDSLQEKQGLKSMQHFALVLQNMKSPTHSNMMILQPHQSLSEIAARPDSQHFKCLLRLAFVPRDCYELAQKDPAAFEYFYLQCTNDVVQERYGTELKFEQAFRLAALHIHQHAVSTNMQKITLKAVEREAGLDKFLPAAILDATKTKEIRKLLQHFLKANSNLTAPGQKQLSALQAKMHYLKTVSDLKSFGGKGFIVTLVEQQHEAMIVVGPRYGIAVVSPAKHAPMIPLVDFDQIETVTLAKEERDTMQRVILHTYDNDKPRISFVMVSEDVGEFLALLEGYYNVLVPSQRQLRVHDENRNNNMDMEEAPDYDGKHRVLPQSWSYPPDLADPGNQGATSTRLVDLANGPPPYPQHIESSRQSAGSHSLEGPELNRSTSDLGVTSELRISDAPLASPDVSTLSGSSESSIHNTDSSEQIASVIASVPAAGEYSDDDDDDKSDATFIADSDTGSSGTVVNNSTAASGSTTPVRVLGLSEFSTQEQDTAENSILNEGRSSMSDDLHTSNDSINQLSTAEDEEEDIMKGEKVRAIAEKLAGKLVLGAGNSPGNSPGPTNGSANVNQSLTEPTNGLDHTDHADHSVGTIDPRNHGDILTKIAAGISPESSDTDSVNTTPSDSPAKTKMDGVVLRPPSLTRAKNSERPNSFGLHSPDNLPQSEADFSNLAQSFGLTSPPSTSTAGSSTGEANGTASQGDHWEEDGTAAIPSVLLHASYNPQIFHDGGLYLDPDIIDLTLIPPPKTPENEEQLMDFCSPDNTSPPPDFGDQQGRAGGEKEEKEDGASAGMLPPDMLPAHIMQRIDSLVQDDVEIGSQLRAMDALLLDDPTQHIEKDNEKESGIESESDSGNETISSENVEIPGSNLSELGSCERSTDLVSQLANRRSYRHINFATSDIDAFIASVTVPPPPKHEEKERLKAERQEVSLPPPQQEKESYPLPPPPPPEPSSAEVYQQAAAPEHTPPNPPTPLGLEDDMLQRLLGANHGDILLDEEFMKYVIPAPPTSDASLGDIPIVRPPTKSQSPSPTREVTITGARTTRTSTSTTYSAGSSSPIAVLDNSEKFDLHKVKDTIWQLEQNQHGTLRRNSSSSLKRPTEAPPPPPPGATTPGAHHTPGGKLGIPRPAPPRRYSSLEPPGTAVSSAPTTPLGHHPDTKTSIEINVNKRPLEGVKSVNSLSADNSPLHQPLQHACSTGTLRGKLSTGQNKLPAPLPPPRRSSMPIGASGASSPLAMESVADRIRLLQHGPKVPVEETEEESDSLSPTLPIQIPVAKVQVVKVETPGSPVPGSPRTKGVSANIQARQEALRQAAQFKKEKLEAGGVGGAGDKGEDVTTTTQSTTTVSSTQQQSSSSSSPVIERLPSHPPRSPAAGEVVAIIPGSPKPSPLLGRSSLSFKSGAGSANSSASPGGGPSSPSITSSTMVPRPYQSPRASPTVHRHTSFTRASGGNPERSTSPFRTFLGEGAKGTGMTAGGSDSEGSTPVSPRKTPGSGAAASGTSGNVFQYPGTLGRAAGLRNTTAQVKQSHARKSIPFQMVHPMIASSSSESSDRTPSPADPDLVTRSLDLAAAAALSSPESIDGRGSYDFSTSQIPSRRGKDSPQQPSFLSAGSGSPRKSGGLVQSLRQAMQNRPSFSTFMGGDKDKEKRKSGIAAGNSSASADFNPPPSQQTATIGSSGTKTQVRTVVAPTVNLEKIGEVPEEKHKATNGATYKEPSSPTTTTQDPNALIAQLITKTYTADAGFTDVNADVDSLVRLMQQQIDSCRTPTSSAHLDIRKAKDGLVAESRQFVTDSKLLVSSATQSVDKLTTNVNQSMHTLVKIVAKCTDTMVCIAAIPQAVTLGSRVKDVALAYKNTVSAAKEAAGKPLSDPSMKLLMRQATSLAAILSQLMKTLKMLEAS